jgi:tetratricopeptide (TPR) repeat protein
VNNENDFELKIRLPLEKLRDSLFAAGLLFSILAVIYANSFDCSWHFDDYINIVENPGIQIKTLSWQEVERGLYGITGSARWQRPFSYFTFAMNYYFDGLNVFWYHVVNFFIHYITSVFLFLFIYNTLKLPVLEGRYEQNAYSIALLATLFWAINPVQVMAVTYIVQRMASMAAMFYIMAMYFYLKGRRVEKKWKSVGFFVLAAFWGILSVGSKENAAMLPVSLFLFDLFLIQGVTIEHIRKNWAVCLFALILVPAIGLVYYDFSSITGDYDKFRPFTMWERVLTQPRVILFYISLLFYPITSRMMLIHDVEISKSLFDPWTTFAAIVVLLLILVVAVLISRKEGALMKWLEKHTDYTLLRIMTGPLISYCIVFFFLNHLIEGSFISLELVYEHRNYLPSMLLFVPLSIFIVYSLNYFRERRRMIVVLSSAITAIIIIMGMTAYTYNGILKDEISLWSNNAEKTPHLAIVHNSLGAAFLNEGRLSNAFTELTKATESFNREHADVEYMTYRLLGYCYIVGRDDEKALFYAKKALAAFPSDAELHNELAAIFMKKKKLGEAESEMKKAISLRKDKASFHINLGKIYLLRGHLDAAIKEAQRGIFLDGNPLEAYWLMSEVFKEKKDYRMYDHFSSLASGFKLAEKRCP